MSKDNQTEKEERTIFIILAIVLLIAIGIIVTWYFTRDKEEKLKDKKEPTTKEVVKEKETTDEISYTKPEIVQTVAVTEESPVVIENQEEISEPVITYGAELQKKFLEYAGVLKNINEINLNDFKEGVTATDYLNNNLEVNISIDAYLINGTVLSLGDCDEIPDSYKKLGIDKIKITYTAIDDKGRLAKKEEEIEIDCKLKELKINNDSDSYNLSVDEKKGEYNLVIDQSEELSLSFYSKNLEETYINDRKISEDEYTVDENNSGEGYVTVKKDEENQIKIKIDEQKIIINIEKVDTSIKLNIKDDDEEIQDENGIYTVKSNEVSITVTPNNIDNENLNVQLLKGEEEIDRTDNNTYNVEINDESNIFTIIVSITYNKGESNEFTIKKAYTFTIKKEVKKEISMPSNINEIATINSLAQNENIIDEKENREIFDNENDEEGNLKTVSTDIVVPNENE